MKFEEGMDHVQMRDGSAYVGDVRNTAFHLDVGLGAPITIPAVKIVWIIFRTPGGFPKDRVQLEDASELAGTVVDQVIQFRSDALGDVAIPTAKVLAAQLLSRFGP
jgi:hypothetical protein